MSTFEDDPSRIMAIRLRRNGVGGRRQGDGSSSASIFPQPRAGPAGVYACKRNVTYEGATVQGAPAAPRQGVGGRTSFSAPQPDGCIPLQRQPDWPIRETRPGST